MVWTDYDDVNDQNAYNHGFQSFLQGFDHFDNPYQLDSKSYEEWSRGWWTAYNNSLTDWRT
jgi:hypothetical protein